MKRFIYFLFYSIISAGLFYAMEFGIPMEKAIPPLGKLLSPATGFWKNAESNKISYPQTLNLKGLNQAVDIIYDDRLVPHIFAQNDHDLYFAQGYVTAQLRLWQMEFQTHFAAGRISEIIGPKAIPLDRLNRRKGLLYAAEESLKKLESEPETDLIISAYTEGVNAYISSLTYKDYPLEYKLMNYKPEPWTKLKCAILLKYMADMLTGTTSDIEMSNAIHLLGEEYIEILFPNNPDSLGSPIVPRGTPYANGKLDLDTPQTPGIFNKIKVIQEQTPENIGSNNWAVNGKKTLTGAPILCNDPHLKLNLPSIWFEIQLSTPDFNSYGVSLPGAPAIIIGFNQNIAWGVTNGTQDVKDWYKLKFKDASKNEYLFDGEWKKITKRIEVIKVKGQQPFYDTVLYTHFGPVVYDTSLVKDTNALDLAISWTGLEPSNELMTFHKLNRAKDYNEYAEALKTFECPGQNFVFACKNGDIAIWQQGKFPAKWPLQGKFIMDGTQSVYQWQGFIPQEENPHTYNPERNFVSSANQHPTDETYPYFYNGRFEYYRNRRINERLSMMEKITIEDMMKLQNDNMNLQAAESLPLFIKLLDISKLNKEQNAYLNELKNWNYFNDAGNVAAAIYEEWYEKLDSLIWDELENDDLITERPSNFNTILLMKQNPNHLFFNIQSTKDVTENLSDLINQSFKITCESLDNWKLKSGKELTWANYKATSVQHLALLMPFSYTNINIGGNTGIVNACSDRWGPSWRMIVSLESPVKAYGVYPGGQSGNPGSPYYNTGIEKWSRGEYFELLFMETPQDQDSKIVLRQKMNNQ